MTPLDFLLYVFESDLHLTLCESDFLFLVIGVRGFQFVQLLDDGPFHAALGDLLGSLLFPTGAYFPGFTLTAACTGAIFGLCLYRHGTDWRFPILAAVLNCVLISYLANSAMIAFITGTPYTALLGVRAVQLTVMLPLQGLVLLWLTRSKLIRRVLDDARTTGRRQEN